jgi:hypothetical protein
MQSFNDGILQDEFTHVKVSRDAVIQPVEEIPRYQQINSLVCKA